MELSSASSSTYRSTVTSAALKSRYQQRIRAYTSRAPRAPLQVTLAEDVLKDYSLRQPLVISLEQDGGQIIASDDVFYMYGQGNTRQEAVLDYLTTLSEYYALLESCDDAPSVQLFSYLQTYLSPKNT